MEDKIQDLGPLLERFKQNITTTTTGGDPEETRRREMLSKYASQTIAMSILFGPSSQRVGRNREAIPGTLGKGDGSPVRG